MHKTNEERDFTVTVASPGEVKRVLTITVPKEELEKEREAVIKEMQKEVKAPGFRKGKVPRKYILNNYEDAIQSDAMRNLLPDVYEQALQREDIHPISEPRFDKVKAEPDVDITFDATVEIRPDVTVKGYSKVKVKVDKPDVDDGRVTDALEQMRERMGSLTVVDRPIKDSDVVLVDYGPLGDDNEVDEKELAVNYPIDLESGNLMPEMKEALLRMETSETKDVKVKYPDDFPEKEMAGQEKMLRVTIKEIKERLMPDLDDEFARGLGEQFEDMESLRRQVKEDLIKEEEKRYLHNIEEQIIDKLIGENPFEVPDAMVENYLVSVLEEDRRRRPQVPDESERENEVREHFHIAAVRTIKKYFILDAVKKQESIEVATEEVDAKISELASASQATEEQVRQYFSHPDRLRSLENELLDQKVLNFLRDSAEIKAA